MNSNLVGIFSDAHSNIDAIQAMYSRESDVSEWICAGDSVGLLPYPLEKYDIGIGRP